MNFGGSLYDVLFLAHRTQMLVAYLEGSRNENKISESERGGRESEAAPKLLTHFKKETKLKEKQRKNFLSPPSLIFFTEYYSFFNEYLPLDTLGYVFLTIYKHALFFLVRATS